MEHNKILMLLQEYKIIKQGLVLPVKIRLFFSTLDELMSRNNQLNQNKPQVVNKQFIDAFQKLAQMQKVRFAHWMITHISKYFKQQSDKEGKSVSVMGSQADHTINQIETSCKIEVFKFGISTWSSAKFKLDKFSRRIDIVNKHRNMLLNLEQYLVRRSKKHKFTLVFETVSKKVSDQNIKVTLYFTEHIFTQLEREITQSIMEAQTEKLLQMQNMGETQPNQKIKHNQSALVFLNSKEIASFLKYKALAMQRLATQNFNFKTIFEKKQIQLKISRSAKTHKIFKLQFSSNLISKELKQNILECFQNKFKYRVENTILEQFSKRYRAVYEKYVFNDKIFDQINLREEGAGEKQDIYFSKGIDNVLTPNTIEFVLIQVKTLGASSQCNIYASLNIPKNTPQKHPINFMLQFYEMLSRGQQQQNQLQQTMQEQFFSILSNPNEQLSMSIQIDDGSSLTKSSLSQPKESKQVWNNKNINRILIQPMKLSEQQIREKLVKDHYVFKQWKRAANGGLICIDLQLIEDQKKMIKKIFATIGNNIFKIIRNGSGIMNMCLPVTIFKKQSHLQTIARNFSYAPLLLESANHSNDALERFKACIAFVVSNCILGISMKKPFNPILGETFQCWIGGCPLYLQQISHHPPISSYYFQGRGYTIYGNIQAKVSLSGLNSGKCWSQKFHYIQFQDGSKIYLTHPKMLIKNLIIGERQFQFSDKCFVYDTKNNYFAQLSFGPKLKGFLSNSTQPQDIIHGEIYRTTTSFLTKFKNSTGGIYPSNEDIAKEICKMQGIWTETIRFDGKEYFDFARNLPLEMQEEPHPLPSNSLHRPDIKWIQKNQIEIAQQNKNKLEQIQRNDRRLRQNNKK